MNKPILSVSGLTIEFASTRKSKPFVAAQNVTFDLQPGEILGIVGESGSGKTVTALSLLRLLPTESNAQLKGEITFTPANQQAVRLDQLSDQEIRKYRGKHLAMIFQEPGAALNPVMTCGKQIVEMLCLHTGLNADQAREKTLTALAKVKLENPERIFQAYPHQLSGGQKQRVMIAMAMACSPAVLIADEPTTALDVSTQKGILELMKQLRDEYQTAIIFISHDLNLLSGFAERTLVMKDGEVVEQGSVDQVFTQPTHPYTKGLLACRPPLHQRLYRLPVLSDFLSAGGSGTGFDPFHPSNIISTKERHTRQSEIYQQKPLVRVKNLKVGFQSRSGIFSSHKQNISAVNGVSLDIFPGETLGLVGESGSGKTSLGRTILRLLEPDAGTIHYQKTNITHLGQQALRPLRKSMQIVFQDPYQSLHPVMTAGEAVMEPMLVHQTIKKPEERRKKALEIFDQVHLPHALFNRMPSAMSGGQRQRLCIARALALQPDFLICDEAVSALDVSVQAQIINLISELKRNLGFTCLFISHDISVVRYLADRILVMRHGKIIDQGEADALCTQPGSDYTRELLRAVPAGLNPGNTSFS